MSSPDAKEFIAKVVILGHTGVGKTSLVDQYVRGQFGAATTSTIGAAFMKKDVYVYYNPCFSRHILIFIPSSVSFLSLLHCIFVQLVW